MVVAASRDSLTCLLSLVPGDPAAPRPDPAEIIARAQKLGFAPAALLSPAEIDALLREAIAHATPLTAVSISPVVNGAAVVTVSEDRMKAVLFLRKGRGGGKPLMPAAVSEAIRASKVKGFDAQKVRKDLLSFFAGSIRGARRLRSGHRKSPENRLRSQAGMARPVPSR